MHVNPAWRISSTKKHGKMLSSVAGRLASLGRGGPPAVFGGLRERAPAPRTGFSTSSGLSDKLTDKYGPKKWLDYNNVVYPPQRPGEERRPAVSTSIVSARGNIYTQSACCVAVRVPSKAQHQVQPEKNVVRGVFRARHVCRRSFQTVAVGRPQGRHHRDGCHFRSAKTGRRQS